MDKQKYVENVKCRLLVVHWTRFRYLLYIAQMHTDDTNILAVLLFGAPGTVQTY